AVVDGLVTLGCGLAAAEASDAVEVLERVTDSIDDLMARVAEAGRARVLGVVPERVEVLPGRLIGTTRRDAGPRTGHAAPLAAAQVELRAVGIRRAHSRVLGNADPARADGSRGARVLPIA